MEVHLSKEAKRNLNKTPLHISIKLNSWVNSLRVNGINYTRQLKGFHDEPLKGPKKGRRSIRLLLKWRAEYVLTISNNIEIVLIERIHPHAY